MPVAAVTTIMVAPDALSARRARRVFFDIYPGAAVSLAIEIISDVVCPWCYIGKRRLEQALELYARERPDAPPPHIEWKPFQLNPTLPEDGMAREEYIKQKFGGNAGQIYARVAQVGTSVGIPFEFERIARQPNTLAPHALIELAGKHDLQDAFVEALFKAYFIDGADLTDGAQLTCLALATGLPLEEVEACLASESTRHRIEAADHHARAIGVEGVPFFIFNGRLAVSGAQEPQTLLQAMLQAASAAQAPARRVQPAG